jgi:exosome complex exonuclease DIS3/RRP44
VSTHNSHISQVTLKNDDAEDSDEEGETRQPVAEEQKLLEEESGRTAAERQPTGRVVGIVKRNWRA